MDYILDTHIAFWALYDTDKLSSDVINIIDNQDNNIYFSAVSVMEISIKHNKFPEIFDKSGRTFYENSLYSGFYTMPLKPKHAILMDDLKIKEGQSHSDPFDRALLAQAKQERFKLITHDRAFEKYEEECIMMV